MPLPRLRLEPALGVFGYEQRAFQNLSGGAYQRGLHQLELAIHLAEFHLYLNAACRVLHLHAAQSGGGCMPFVGGHRARQDRGRRHTDGACYRMRSVAFVRREVARHHAARHSARRHDHRLGQHAVGHIAHAHALTGLKAQGFQAGEHSGIGVQLGRRLVAAQAQVGGAHQHHHLSCVDAGDLQALDGVDALAGGKDLPGDGTPGVQKVHQHGGCRALHAVDAHIAVVVHLAARRAHLHVDAGAGVDVVDPHGGGLAFAVCRDQPLLDSKGPHTGQHVAAVGPGVHTGFLHADLGKQVVHIAIGLRRAGNDGDLAGQRVAAAQAVDLQLMGRSQGCNQRAVAGFGVARQPVGQEERPPGSAATHQNARNVGAHGSAWCCAVDDL